MRVAYYMPPDDHDLSGCDLWRVGMPMKHLKKYNSKDEFYEINEFRYKLDPEGNIIGTSIDPSYFDLVHVARPFMSQFIQMGEEIKKSGVKFTMDFDDDFTSIHHGNAALERLSDDVFDSFEKVIGMADGVIVTTPFLKEKFGHLNDNFTVIDNYIPEVMIRSGPRPKEKILGWAGGVDVHPDDLQVVGTSVRDFLWTNRDWKFHHIGSGQVNKILKAPTVEFGTVGVLEYMAQIEQFKVGIAPLSVSDFNKSKSRLKVLEMSALGVPWVASPLPEYKRIHDEWGVGILADSPEEWREAFQKYANSQFYRLQQISRGLEFARANTFKKNHQQWTDFFQQTLDK